MCGKGTCYTDVLGSTVSMPRAFAAFERMPFPAHDPAQKGLFFGVGSSLAALIKHPDRKQLRGERLYLGLECQRDGVCCGGKVGQQREEAG